MSNLLKLYKCRTMIGTMTPQGLNSHVVGHLLTCDVMLYATNEDDARSIVHNLPDVEIEADVQVEEVPYARGPIMMRI